MDLAGSSELRGALQRIGAQLLPVYDESSTVGEEEVVIYRPSEAAWNLWLKEQKMYMRWNTHKRADYRKENKRIQAGALDFKYVYLCNHAKTYTAQHNPNVPPEKRRKGKETIKVGCHAKIVARQYTDANQIEIRYRWRHNGHTVPSQIDVLMKKDNSGIKEWLGLRVGQLYTTEPFMDLVRFTAQEFAAFEQDPANMAALPEIYRLLRIKPSDTYSLIREQLLQSATWPDNAARKAQIWQELISECNGALHMLYQKNGFLDDVPLASMWEHLAGVKAHNRRLRDILYGQPVAVARPQISLPQQGQIVSMALAQQNEQLASPQTSFTHEVISASPVLTHQQQQNQPHQHQQQYQQQQHNLMRQTPQVSPIPHVPIPRMPPPVTADHPQSSGVQHSTGESPSSFQNHPYQQAPNYGHPPLPMQHQTVGPAGH
ncbi:hypothetical protein V1525DRAFT_412256 [Lipomyces kononenkoae]|uniref:Uncharacterized protein n=1 Tax=Lipomyces kononenkoae TaxID=34357 RepID=A0ACC3SSV8_LIPKO